MVQRLHRRRSKAALVALLLVIAIGFLYGNITSYFQAIFVLKNTASDGRPKRSGAENFFLYPIREQDQRVPTRARSLRARLYQPEGPKHPAGVVLVVGIHHLGVNEPRGVALARSIASGGITVLAIELPEFVEFRFDPAIIESISSSAGYLATLTGRTTAGVIGISFAGGAALLAAADPVLQKTIGFVAALGAQCDLNRVAGYLAGSPVRDPSGNTYTVSPHPYGGRVVLFSYLDHLFAPEDLASARVALLLYLQDQHREARQHAQLMRPAARDKMLRILDERDPKNIRDDVLAAARSSAANLGALSPCGKLSKLQVPVYLIAGADDPVVPSTETLWLARDIPSQHLRWALVSPVLRHAEIGKKYPLGDYWKLINFFSDLLSQARRLP